jgi:hypothetical protein
VLAKGEHPLLDGLRHLEVTLSERAQAKPAKAAGLNVGHADSKPDALERNRLIPEERSGDGAVRRTIPRWKDEYVHSSPFGHLTAPCY